jgi:hypothetical protein
MTRLPKPSRREKLAAFERLMRMKKTPEVESCKVREPIDPFPVEDVQDQEGDNAEADHQ